MKVKELRAAIAGLPDDAEVVMQVRFVDKYPVNEYHDVEEADYDSYDNTIFLMSKETEI